MRCRIHLFCTHCSTSWIIFWAWLRLVAWSKLRDSSKLVYLKHKTLYRYFKSCKVCDTVSYKDFGNLQPYCIYDGDVLWWILVVATMNTLKTFFKYVSITTFLLNLCNVRVPLGISRPQILRRFDFLI